jgi:hypothetical protein
MTRVSQDRRVIDGTSAAVADAVIGGFDVESRIADALPPDSRVLAPAMTATVERTLREVLAEVLAAPDLQRAFADANRSLHQVAIEVLRGESDIVVASEGAVSVNVVPLIAAALGTLQDAGIVPDSIVLPVLPEGALPGEAIAQLEVALGVDLPDDLGTIALFEADVVDAASDAVVVFDRVVIMSIVITAVLIALALVLAEDRLRMAAWLGVGSAIVLVLGPAIIDLAVDFTETGQPGSPATRAGDAIVRAIRDDLAAFETAAVVLAVAVAAGAWIAMRPRWAVTAYEAGRGAALGIAHDAGTVVAGATGSAAGQASLRAWVALHTVPLGWLGVAVAAFFVVWRLGGLELAVAVATGVGMWLAVVRLAAGPAPRQDAAMRRDAA